ncbi:hypothetical protein BV20DRAFT_371400 [Pilatotrama ljubarskyi]|nr:hypothetical protein BV20DRAFT_371400 [Pilatotrama ljubarskyi]
MFRLERQLRAPGLVQACEVSTGAAQPPLLLEDGLYLCERITSRPREVLNPRTLRKATGLVIFHFFNTHSLRRRQMRFFGMQMMVALACSIVVLQPMRICLKTGPGRGGRRTNSISC